VVGFTTGSRGEVPRKREPVVREKQYNSNMPRKGRRMMTENTKFEQRKKKIIKEANKQTTER
jgi:hypothetical protein